jgi:hypothetical protein
VHGWIYIGIQDRKLLEGMHPEDKLGEGKRDSFSL